MAQSESQEHTVTITDVTTIDLTNSQIIRIEFNLLNGADDEVFISPSQFEMLDADLKKYGSTSGYELRDRGESISRGICDIILGESVNPGLSIDYDICFETTQNTKYDSLILYDNQFSKDIDSAKIIPLIDNSLGHDALVKKIQSDNEDVAARVDEIESDGGCLIATAAYNTELAPEVQNLREIRNKMYETKAGSELMHSVNNFYYSFSPTVADLERQNSMFRDTVRIFITPAMMSFTIQEHETIESEEGLILYVSTVVLLNAGMYIGAPTLFIFGIKKVVIPKLHR